MSPVVFNAREVYQIAVQIERNGAEFYAKAATVAPDEKTRNLFNNLVKMEQEHEKTFSAMLAQIVQTDEDNGLIDPDDEALKYLQHFAGGKIFDITADPTKLIKPETTVQDIFRIAINCERESVLFYTGFRFWVPNGFGKDSINDIIQQEVGHIAILTDLLEEADGE